MPIKFLFNPAYSTIFWRTKLLKMVQEVLFRIEPKRFQLQKKGLTKSWKMRYFGPSACLLGTKSCQPSWKFTRGWIQILRCCNLSGTWKLKERSTRRYDWRLSTGDCHNSMNSTTTVQHSKETIWGKSSSEDRRRRGTGWRGIVLPFPKSAW